MRHKIVRSDGTTVLTPIKYVHYRSQCNHEENLRFGAVIPSYIEVEVFLQNGNMVSVGEQLSYYQVYDVDSSFNPSTETETQIGLFTVYECDQVDRSVYRFVAYDNLKKLDADFSVRLRQITFPITAENLVAEAATVAGVTYNPYPYPNPFQNITLDKIYSDSVTCRDIFSAAAELQARYCSCLANGTIVFGGYGNLELPPFDFSNKYIICPTDQQEYYDSNDNRLIQAFYKQDGLSYSDYIIQPVDSAQILRSDGTLLGNLSSSSPRNTYYVSGNIIADMAVITDWHTSGGVTTSAVFDDVAYNIYLQASNVYDSNFRMPRKTSVRMFPFRFPYKCGSYAYVEDTSGLRFIIPIMSVDITESAVTVETYGDEYYTEITGKSNTAEQKATSLDIRLNALETEVDGKVSKSGDVISGGTLFIRNSAGANDHQGRLVLNNPDITLGETHTKTIMGEVLFDDSVTSLYKATIYGNITQANTVQLALVARNWDSGGNALLNRLTLSSLANGTVRVEVSHPNAWLDAISAATPTLVTTVSSIATAASGITINSAYYAQWGKVAQLRLRFTPSSALTGNTSVATLVSGKRPAANMWAPANIRLGTNTTAYISDSGAVIVTGSFTAGTWYEVVSTYILA